MAVMARRTPWILRGMARLTPDARSGRQAEQLTGVSALGGAFRAGFGNPTFARRCAQPSPSSANLQS